MKYLVMEIHPAYAVVLDTKGKFIKAANMHYTVGQELEEIMELKLPQNPKESSQGLQHIIMKIASVAACLMLFAGMSIH